MDCLTLHEQYFSNRVGKKMALGRAYMLTKLRLPQQNDDG
jgi:hypothetical protein